MNFTALLSQKCLPPLLNTINTVCERYTKNLYFFLLIWDLCAIIIIIIIIYPSQSFLFNLQILVSANVNVVL